MDNLSYGDFAYIYDRLTDDVEYAKRVDYIESLINKHYGKKAELICDLGCGTGTVCSMLSNRGYDMIGIDYSESMLSVASQKNSDGKILFLNQNMTDFELYGTADVFLSLLDSVNYVTYEDELDRMFSLVNNYLNPDGIFIFDINTKYKFEKILFDNTFVYETDDIFYTWENFYDNGYLDFYLNFFVRDGKKYKRFTEHHTQKYYSQDYLRYLAKKNNMSVAGLYDDLSINAPKNDSERVFFVLKKKN